MSHYEERLARDLSRIQTEISKLGEMAVTALRNAVAASLMDDLKLANRTVIHDKPINRKKKLVNDLSHAFLAVHQPSGAHLRQVVSIMGIVDELERIGDYAVTIARNAIQLPKTPSGPVKAEVEALAENALTSVTDSVAALSKNDAELAKKTLAIAKQAEGRSDALFDSLAGSRSKNRDEVRTVIATLTISHQLKRASDRAQNICEEAIFAITGEPKKRSILKILFLDPGNDCQSQIAEAVARRAFPRSGEYSSAGRKAKSDLRPGLRDFMESKGLSHAQASLDAVEADPEHASAYDLVISLEGDVQDYFPGQQPYRTTYLEWDVGGVAGKAKDPESEFNAMYQSIGDHVRELLVTMRGEEAG